MWGDFVKYRKDFVTNSSSSSFVCDVCGAEASGFDMCLSDAGMYRCVNDHTFCEDEAIEASAQEMIDSILEMEFFDHYDEENNKLIYVRKSKEELESMDSFQLRDIIVRRERSEVPECMCPICQFIEYSESDMAMFLEKEYGVSRQEVFAEVKKANKRRRKLYDSEYIIYVCQKYELNPAEIVATWKERFGSFAAFDKYISE